MAIIFMFVVINVYAVSSDTPIKLEYKPMRPSFAGATGGTLGNYLGQIIPPGTPWPSKAEDYSTTPKAISGQANLEDKMKETTSIVEIVTPPKILAPNRPPFLGPTGGNFIPQIVPPGKPWSARPEDYEGIGTTPSKVVLHDKNKETTFKPSHEEVLPPTLTVPNRPPFLGPTGGNFIPQIVPPGKPWPARPEDYDGFNATSSKPNLSDKNEATTSLLSVVTHDLSKPLDEEFVPSKLPIPNRPPFLGPTGGNFIPQIIPPGKPWPARPEDYEGFSVTSHKPNLGSRYKNTIVPSSTDEPCKPVEVTSSMLPLPTGNPLPAKPETEEGSSTTFLKPDLGDINTEVIIEKFSTSSPTLDPDNINTEVITLFSLLSNNTVNPKDEEPASNPDQTVTTPFSEVLSVTSQMPYINLYFDLESIITAIKNNTLLSGGSNIDKSAKPSLILSLNLDALKESAEGALVADQSKDPLKATEQFLAVEKLNGDVRRNTNFLTVSVTLGGLETITNHSSVRFNVRPNKNTAANISKTSEDILETKSHVPSKLDQDASKNAFVSVLVNIDDLKRAIKDDSSAIGGVTRKPNLS